MQSEIRVRSRASHAVLGAAMCRCLRIQPSGFYAWLKNPLSRRAQEDVRQTAMIRQAQEDSGKVYGYRKLHGDLLDQGETCCPNRVARLASLAGIKADKGFVFVYDEPGSEETLEILNVLKGERRAMPVVFYSMDRHIEQVIRAMLLGVTDYLEWPVAPKKLDALTASIDERTRLRRREEECRFKATQLVSTLSPRERDTLALLTKGNSNKAIASELNISPRTVEIHRANAFKKINAVSTADAVRIGLYAGLDLSD